ncbi:MAG TPA: methionine synthase, partial [Verrucomicrobia bacterium]|nr:methionine synthase [Verrucomicrobiota bacterium]
KNLVDIILSNNGYQVVNLGVKVSIEKMVEAVRESRADILGMSGLLVKSVQIMRENLKAMEAAGLRIPVLLGGAALTENFVVNDCQPVYSGPVCYCRDAFDSLALFRELKETGTIQKSNKP